jgi:hypothetical protein
MSCEGSGGQGCRLRTVPEGKTNNLPGHLLLSLKMQLLSIVGRRIGNESSRMPFTILLIYKASIKHQ